MSRNAFPQLEREYNEALNEREIDDQIAEDEEFERMERESRPAPLQSHDHPDFPSMKWTDLEMDAIKAYGELCIKEYKAAIVKRLTGCKAKFSPDIVAKVRAIRDSGEGYKKANRLYPMDRHTYFRIVGHKGAYK